MWPILLQAVHDVLHIIGVDVVSFQQAAVAGALHSKLQNRDTAKLKEIVCFAWEITRESERQASPAASSPPQTALRSDTAAAQTHSA